MYLLRWLKAVKEGNTFHAVLLCGQTGLGKKELARRAAALYLKGTEDTSVLKECPFYREWAAEESATGGQKQADPVRACCEFLTSGTFGAGRHCVLFPDVHLLNEAAQNIMLKTLEEPPDGALLLLTGCEEGILPTIRSRCMKIRLGAQPLETTAAALREKGVDAARAALAASWADGVPERAARLAEEENAAFVQKAEEILEEALFAAPPFEAALSLCTDKKKADAEKAQRLLEVCCEMLRDAAAESCGAGRFFHPEGRKLRERISASFTKAQIRSMMEHTLAAAEDLYRQAAPKPTLDMYLAGLIS